MGLFDFLKKQFIDVIDWTEPGPGILAYRYPMQDKEIQSGAQLTVRDSQMAMFVDEGKIADVFKPGRYTLNTNTLPVLTNLRNWDKLFASPFKSDVYYFSTREQTDQRWGTTTPIVIRDQSFGPIRIRAHGTFSYKIIDPKKFYQKLSGTAEVYTAEEIAGQLRSMILTELASHFGGAQVQFVDMAANQAKFSSKLNEILDLPFATYGMSLETFFVQSISLPEELQSRLDKVASMNMIGDLQKYAQFQTAEAIGTAAANEGGVAGAGASLGAGVAIGQAMMGQMGQMSGGGSSGTGGGASDPMAALDRLHEMLKKGVITQAEFDAKKTELLKKIN